VEGRPRSEHELALRAQSGDTRAFEQLVEPHREVMFRVAYLIVRNAADAEEAAQDALVKAWRALNRFRPHSPVRPWLVAIAANEARNRQRGTGRRERLALRTIASSSGGAAPSPEELTVAAAERRRLLDAVEQLPDGQRLVLECRYLLSLSEEETAAALGIPRGTVKSRAARALDQLREVHEARL
jgi:RNA polymerase sigma factor (sigma-70 family)